MHQDSFRRKSSTIKVQLRFRTVSVHLRSTSMLFNMLIYVAFSRYCRSSGWAIHMDSVGGSIWEFRCTVLVHDLDSCGEHMVCLYDWIWRLRCFCGVSVVWWSIWLGTYHW
jgi:hypothetical protein